MLSRVATSGMIHLMPQKYVSEPHRSRFNPLRAFGFGTDAVYCAVTESRITLQYNVWRATMNDRARAHRAAAAHVHALPFQ